MEAKYLKINPADNVAVAITALPAGEKLTVDGKGITLNEDVPEIGRASCRERE